MSQFADLKNEEFFPDYEELPWENQIAGGNWCFLGDIVMDESLMRKVLRVKDIQGYEVRLAFYTRGQGREFDNDQVGNTVAILNPRQRQFLNGSVGIRLEDATRCKIFFITLKDLFELGNTGSRYVFPEDDGTRRCHGCDKTAKTLKKCQRCKYFWYCDKDCQVKGWQEKRHKTCCRAVTDPDLRAILTMDWDGPDRDLKFPL